MLKVAKVIKRQPEVVGRQNKGADAETGTSGEKCRRADTMQSMEPGMLGSGVMRRPSLLESFRPTYVKKCSQRSESNILASKMVPGVIGSGRCPCQIDLGMKEKKRCRITPRLKRKTGIMVMPYFQKDRVCDRMFLVGCSS